MIPQYADITHPMTERIRAEPNSKTLNLSDTEKDAVAACKTALQSAAVLNHPLPTCTTYQLVTDCSQVAVGAVLHQMVDGTPFLVELYSKKLSDAQKRYSAFDRELLAAYLAVLHFRHLIEEQNVSLYTDHRPLVGAFTSKRPAKLDRQQRHLSLLSEYITEMHFIRGDNNVVADCLSRSINAVKVSCVDLISIAEQQVTDSELAEISSQLKPFLVGKLTLYCDTSLATARPYVPRSIRPDIFAHLHNISHCGVQATVRLIKARYYWPNMDREIRAWARSCEAYQAAKVHRHTRSPVMPLDIPSARFSTVHIDIVGPLPPSRQHGQLHPTSHRYILTCIDRVTRWVEAAPLHEISAAAVATAFLDTWVSRFGVPLYVVTDRGTQFE